MSDLGCDSALRWLLWADTPKVAQTEHLVCLAGGCVYRLARQCGGFSPVWIQRPELTPSGGLKTVCHLRIHIRGCSDSWGTVMKDVRVDGDGEFHCWNCGNKGKVA